MTGSGRKRRDPFERWAEKVDVTPGCWFWTACLSPAGYGQFGVGSRTDGSDRLVYAHRFSYEQYVGSIPNGLEIDHACCDPAWCKGGVCPHRSCVNPTHLEAVTRRENIARGNHPTARARRLNECYRGHPYNEKNTYVGPNGKRVCRVCARKRDRIRYYESMANDY